MKLLFLFPFLFAFGLSGMSQTTVPIVPNKSDELLKTIAPVTISYCCPRCTYSSALPGICPRDRVNLIQEDTYYCPEHLTTSKSLIKCPTCGKMMKKMEHSQTEAAKKPAIPGGQ
jgi:hypothetical protein